MSSMKISAAGKSAALKIALLGSAATLLQGCVAAVVPLAAGGLLTGAAPNYEPGDGEVVDPDAPADGTVIVQPSQDQLTPPPAAPAPAAIAEAAVEPPADDTLSGTPGLAVDAVSELDTPPAALVEAEPEENDTSFAATDSTTAFAAIEEAPDTGLSAPDALTVSEPDVPPVTEVLTEPEADLAAVAEPESVAGPMESTLETTLDAPAGTAIAVVEAPPEVSASEPEALVEAEAIPAATEATTEFAEAFETEPVGGEDVDPSALAAAPAETGPAVQPSVQLLDVDSRVTFDETTIDASNLSAADAAAALTALPAVEEPAVDTSNLARTAPVAEIEAEPELPVSAEPVAELAIDTAEVTESPGPESVIEEVASPAPASPAVAAIEPQVDPAPQLDTAQNVAAAPAAEPPVSATTPVPGLRSEVPPPNAITSLLSYANQREFASGQNRQSAMLADRFSLEPNRARCGGVQPTVLIDLDPKGGLFSPSDAANPPSGLGVGLAQLRSSGVKIAWISGNPSSEEDNVRFALLRSALDIFGGDLVLLIRDEDDRKQTLREELAQTHCLIAIAGDERTDFDELYQYLLDPGEARSLEVLYGEGWFLIPQPLVTETPNP